MLMNSPKLSICIATLNRATFIGETLESIISQATHEVEIVVVDGASIDNTELVLKRYQQQFPRLRYFRQDVNHGVDRDYNRAVELAQGEYCWFMSDDDVLKPEAIRTVLNQLEPNYGLIIVNTEARNFDFSEVLDRQRLCISADKVYEPGDAEALFIETAEHVSFIGSVVIRRSIWNAREKETYFGTRFVHVGVIFQGPLLENTLVIAEPLVMVRFGNDGSWKSNAFEVWMFKWPDLIWSFPDFSDAAKNHVVRREPWRKLRALLFYRAWGVFSKAEYMRWIASRDAPRFFKLAARIIAGLPVYVVALATVTYLSLFYRKSRILKYEVRHSRIWKDCFKWLQPKKQSDGVGTEKSAP